ncbi:hypothetical protein [Elizabethkingia anophelis]|uniref:hypothetical protein n=1 Tax=Elizabethkingia anophelis TaxID=1117645 RepID=UPI0032091E8D
MRYEPQHKHTTRSIVEIVDLEAKHSWESEVVTVYNDSEKKKKKSDLIANALNLHEELSKISSKTPKARILEIIKKYQ